MKNKNYGKYITCLVISVISCVLAAGNAMAFNSDTHKSVTKTSLEIISEINEKKLNVFDKEDEKYWNTVVEYSVKPDEDENQGAYKYHFYNPVTERNYMGEKDTSLSRCVNHFNNAVNDYKSDKPMSYKELGRALHFSEDGCTPVHSGYIFLHDAILKFPLHVRFEKVCDKNCDNCQAVVSLEILKYFEANNLEVIAKSSSILSSDNYYNLENFDDDNINEETLAKNAVLNAQVKVTGILYKFFKQVQSQAKANA